ncbi:type II secretion system F family protein [Sphingobium nicotianae]|uniref:Type II secretion system F family protein n=1 Tax=Sphingobium nicotianae TaxID=2782607 RepID=A0A9X1IR79_9SPHN|nr:type II secretion system F family protein [Sphingobium nicotianae]MBT2187258.1 type II secretion system F family protein [Sphingobium nicotianae]
MSDTVIRTLVLVLIFGTVFLISEMVLGQWRASGSSSRAINKRLRMIEQGNDRREIITQIRKDSADGLGKLPGLAGRLLGSFEKTIRASKIGLTAKQGLAAMAAAAATVFCLIVISAGLFGFGLTLGTIQLALVLAICIGIVLPMLFLAQVAQKRRAKMQEQFPVALDIFVRGLRAGHPIASALNLLATEMEDPIGSEFGLVTDEVAYGADLRDSLQDMADRWDLEDMRMFVVSLSVQNETGGNLAEILENLSQVIRERASMYMKVRALSSEGRMSAKVLTALPIGTFALVFATNPAFYLEYSNDPAFIMGFSLLIGLYLLGVFIIRRMVDLKV